MIFRWSNASVGDVADNCPNVFNPDQADADSDGIGDACEPTTGTLIVKKIVQCAAGAECSNLPIPEDFPMFFPLGNNPNPSSFKGSATGTSVTLGPGNYAVGERLPSTPDGLELVSFLSDEGCIDSIQPGETKTTIAVSNYTIA